MPTNLTSTFQADFSKFQAAVDQAQTTLRSFDDSSKNVAKSLTAMENSVSGVKIVQQASLAAEAVDRIGGVSKLTQGELQRLGTIAAEAAEKMKALGQDVPAGIQNIADRARGASEELLRLQTVTTQNKAATVDWGSALSTASGYLGAFGINATLGGIVSFTKSVFDSATAIHDMGERLGISSEAVQGFKFAAEQAGSSMDAVGGAITKMNKNLAEGDKSTVEALKKAGLSFQDIRSMRPEDAFLAITDAIAKIPDPMEQSDVTLKLFGRSAAELLPAIKEGFRQVADGASKMSNETTDALQKANDAWKQLGNSVTIVTGTILADTIDAVKNVSASWRSFGEFVLNVSKSGFAAAAGFAVLNEQLDKIVADVGPLEAMSGHVYQSKEDAEAAAKAFKEWKTATDELNTAGAGWQGTLDKIDGNVVEAIKYYLEAGVSQSALAKAYWLSDTAIKAVAQSMEAAKKAAQDLAKAQAEADALQMTAYTNRLKILETITAANSKAYGSEEQIKALERLDAQERALTESVYANINSEKDRMKLIEQYGAKHEEINAKIIALELKRAGVVNNQVLAELDAQKQLNAMYGLGVDGLSNVETGYSKLMKSLDELHAKKVIGIDQTNQENLIYKQYTDSLAASAIADDKARDAKARNNEEAAKIPGLLKAAEQATRSYAASALAGASTGGAFQAPSFAGYLPAVQSFKLPSYADGGVGDFGTGTLAMLHGKEAIVPLGSTLTNGGSTVVISIAEGAIVQNYPIMNDPIAKREISALIGDALVQKLRAAGMRFTSGA